MLLINLHQLQQKGAKLPVLFRKGVQAVMKGQLLSVGYAGPRAHSLSKGHQVFYNIKTIPAKLKFQTGRTVF